MIGEAVKQLSRELTEAHSDIPWRDLARFRDVVVHAYFGLRDQVAWEATVTIVPELLSTVTTIIA